ncbi:helix-turn-helix domain-containing protein [Sandarakinorhabdus sp. AAP62]|uniref:helix-turn-helix domain-containing protein n=1 Tax=Sandarakinorhabdus sp. AAP62 TaxID=1248916 RepID=UPI00036EFF38|nr:helix-turn-helix domain-containing protein [Sandarakinorhabdus sp. AAP62]
MFDDHIVYDTDAAAARLGLARSTLEKMRGTGQGPVFCRLGRRIIYIQADIDDWLMSRRVRSTSQRVRP